MLRVPILFKLGLWPRPLPPDKSHSDVIFLYYINKIKHVVIGCPALAVKQFYYF